MICLSRNSSSFLKFLFQSWEKRSLKRICSPKNEYFDCWWPAGRRLRAIEGSLCGRGERKGLMEGSMQEMHPHMVWPREQRESMDCKLPKERTGPWENGNQLSIWLLLKRGGERRRGEEMENSCQLFRAYKPHKFWHFLSPSSLSKVLEWKFDLDFGNLLHDDWWLQILTLTCWWISPKQASKPTDDLSHLDNPTFYHPRFTNSQ